MATRDYPGDAMSEETFETNCTALCPKKNLVKKAVRSCVDCKKYFCSACLEVHNGLHDDHNTVEPSVVFPPQTTNMPTEECKTHVGKMIDFWCVQHDVVCCVSCAFLSHRSCEDVKDIKNAIKDIFKQEEFDTVKKKLNSNLEYIKSRQHFLDVEKENLLVEKNAQLSKIEQHTQKLISIIKDLDKKAKDEINAVFQEVGDRIKNLAEDCKHYEEDTTECLKQLDSSTGNEPQMFITMNTAQQTIAQADKKCREPGTGKHAVVFKPDSSIEAYLAGLKSLGTNNKIVRKYELQHKQEINVKMDDDSSNCDIEGSCLLPDGSVVVTDIRNNKLKHIDISSASVIDSCQLPGSPCGVCCVGQQELAVALWDKKIQLVTLGRKMTLSRTIDVKHNCYGIAYHNGELFVSDNSTIYVYNMPGSLLRKLTNITSSSCKHIAFSKDGKNIYAACDKGGLVCTDRPGNPVYTVTDVNNRKYRGVCLDDRYNLFVCGWMSDNVVQMSEDGETVGEILTKSDGVHGPKSLCFDPSRQRLIITQWNSTVLVFELQFPQ